MSNPKRRTRPSGTTYVRHIPRWDTERTRCGLFRVKVNCVVRGEEADAECQRCHKVPQ